MIKQIRSQFFSHSFCEGGDKGTFAEFGTPQNLLKEIVNLVLAGTHFDDGVEQTRRAYYLFHDYAVSLCQFEVGRGCRDIDYLVHHIHKLVEF